MPIYLTEEETALQLEKSREMRKHFEDFCEDVGERFNNDEIGLMISGGIDSTITLFSMLSRGIRPRLYTFSVKGFPDNSDVRRVRHIGDHFDLPVNVVEMPDDDELPAEFARWELNEDWRLHSRPDIEVGFCYDQLALAAKNDGIKAFFCGLDPVNLFTQYLLARERRARVGEITGIENDAWRVNDQTSTPKLDQYLAFGSNIYKRHGIFLINPHYFVTYTGVFDGLPWHICSRPRDRAIGTAAFAEEYADLKQNAVGVSMLKGDTGGRDYFEEHIPKSKFAQDFMRLRAQDDPSVLTEGFSATQFYNQLKKEREELQEAEIEADEDDETTESDESVQEASDDAPVIDLGLTPAEARGLWDFFGSHQPGGQPVPDGYEHPWNIVDGKVDDSWMDEEDEDEDEEVETASLFSSVLDSSDEDEDDDDLDEMSPDIDLTDKRIDCWGRPIREVPVTSDCPRARAGLCGHADSPGFDAQVCGFSVSRIEAMILGAQSITEQCFDNDPALTEVVQKWVSKCRDLLVQKVKIGEEEERLHDKLMEYPQETSRTPFKLDSRVMLP